MITDTSSKSSTAVAGFLAMASYLKSFDVMEFADLRPEQAPKQADITSIGKLLLNSLSSEYALRITPVVNDEQYLQSSLHWTFPQAYYSTLFSARAFLAVQGINVSNEDLVRRRIGTSVVRGYYPAELGYYVTGAIDNYTVKRLQSVYTGSDVQGDIRKCLIMTRTQRMMRLRTEIQNNPKTAFRSERTGEIIQKFNTEQYKALAKQMGYTTWFDIMARLRISVNNRDVESFVSAEVNIREFHAALVQIVSAINAVHEIHIRRTIGKEPFLAIIGTLPGYLTDIRERLLQIAYNHPGAFFSEKQS